MQKISSHTPTKQPQNVQHGTCPVAPFPPDADRTPDPGDIEGQPPATWPYRLWTRQAQQLSTSPATQRLALLHHITIMQRHTDSPERWLWLQTLGEGVSEEVRHV